MFKNIFKKKLKFIMIIVFIVLLLPMAYLADKKTISQKIAEAIRGFFNTTSSTSGGTTSSIAGNTVEGGTSSSEYAINGLSGDLLKQVSINATDGSITIKEDILNKIIENIDKSNIDLKKYGVKDTKAFMQKVLETDLGTYLPDFRKRDKIGSKTNDSKLYGAIQIKRYYKDGQSELLEYKPYEEYRKEVAKFGIKIDESEKQEKEYQTKEAVDNAYNNIKRYFTLDTDGNIIVANLSSTEIKVEHSEEAKNDIKEEDRQKDSYTYSLNITKMNYRSLVSKYGMSAELLVDLLLITENEEFVNGVADLARNSKIVISIQDNATNTVNVNNYNITKEYKNSIEVSLIGSGTDKSDTYPESKNFEPYIKVTTTINTNTIHALISEVDSWYVNYQKIFTNEKNPQSVTENEYKEDDDEDYYYIGKEIKEETQDVEIEKKKKVITTTTTYSSYDKDNNELSKETETEETRIDTEEADSTNSSTVEEITSKYEKKTNKTHKVTETRNSNKFTDGTITTTSNENRFLGLLSNKTGVYEKLYKNDGTINENALFPEKEEDRKIVKYKTLDDSEDYIQNRLISGANIFFDLLSDKAETEQYEQIMKYFLYKYTGDNYGVTNINFEQYKAGDFSIGGSLGVFGTSLTKEEFIEKAKAYKPDDSDYQTYMAAFAGDFYDVCTSIEYNVNPVFAYAHACLETGYGSSNGCKNNKNYFGYAHYNNASEGKKYDTVADSIKDYCSWVVYNATPGTDSYNANRARAEELSSYNASLNGTPDSNIYVLYVRYAVLNRTHDGNFGGPEWFTREAQGNQCTHPSGSETTLQEHADYAEYTTNKRLTIAKDIFGLAGSIDVTGEKYTNTRNGKVYTLFKQGNYPDLEFYGQTVRECGCSLTATAIIASGYNPSASPRSLYTVSYEPNAYYFDRAFNGVGIQFTREDATNTSNTIEKIKNYLNQGKPVMIYVKKDAGSEMTSSQHYMALLDISGDKVFVGEPGGHPSDWYDINYILKGLQQVFYINN